MCLWGMFTAALCSNGSFAWWISPQPLKQAISRPHRLWCHAALRPCIMWAISSLKSYCEKRRGFFFFISLNAPLPTTKQIRLKCSPQITGFQAQAGRGLWQQTMIDSLEGEERRQRAERSPDRLRSAPLLMCRGETAEAEFWSTGSLFKTPLKPVFIRRVRTQSGLRLNPRPWKWLQKYIRLNNKPTKSLSLPICVDHGDAHRPDFFRWRKEKREIKAKSSGGAAWLDIFDLRCSRLKLPGPGTMAKTHPSCRWKK